MAFLRSFSVVFLILVMSPSSSSGQSPSLPPNASGVIMPFSLSVQAVWDVKTQKLYGLYWGVVDPANNKNFGWTPFAIPVVVNPNSMNFAAAWGFSQAPLASTTVEILEFRLG